MGGIHKSVFDPIQIMNKKNTIEEAVNAKILVSRLYISSNFRSNKHVDRTSSDSWIEESKWERKWFISILYPLINTHVKLNFHDSLDLEIAQRTISFLKHA